MAGVRFRWNRRYNGRMVLTISADMSVNRLVNPSMTTVRLTGAVKRREASRSPRFFSAWLALSTWYTLLLHGVAERARWHAVGSGRRYRIRGCRCSWSSLALAD